MARGRAASYDTQREDILARAAELFALRGYAGTSMNDVAGACGISKPALYHYVRDKSQLLGELASSHVARLQDLVNEVRARQLAPDDCLRQLIERFVLEYAGARHAHRVLTEDVKFLDTQEQQRLLGRQRKVVAGFVQAVRAARPDLINSDLATPLTMLLFGMMNWMFTWLRPDGTLSHEQMGPVVADLFLGGLGAVRLNANDQTGQRGPSCGPEGSHNP